jgi:hypothetical protein
MTRVPFIVIDGKPYRWRTFLNSAAHNWPSPEPRRQAKWRSLQPCTTTAARPPSARHPGAICNQACSNIRPLRQRGAAVNRRGPFALAGRAVARQRKPRKGAVECRPCRFAACAGRAPAASNRLPKRDSQRASIMLRSSCVDHSLFSAFYVPWVSLATLRHGRQHRRFLLRRSDER